jgi:6-phosphogluconate dehydrogenase
MEHPTRQAGTRETTVTTSNRMRLGMVGLGRMGPNIVRRLMRDSRNCVVFDVDPEAVKPLESGESGWTSIASHRRRRSRSGPQLTSQPVAGGSQVLGSLEEPFPA